MLPTITYVPSLGMHLQVQIPHFVRIISLVMADQLRTVVLKSIRAFSHLWDAFDLAADPHAASAGCPLEKQDGSAEVHGQLLLHYQTVILKALLSPVNTACPVYVS